ncbi:cellulose binding domain-containing protein [Actinoallomurus sp. CA-142502]|uniref:cellulose binding domain-containing protein n=1 Tax=Actinoallomurus sp. CA-142502 TaxID=3239885 RepID=UPI003D92F29E
MRSRRVISAILALALGVFGGVLATGASPAYAAVRCAVDYTVNDWGSGFTASITLHNLGDRLDGWTLTYAYTGNQTLTQGWSGDWSQSGRTVTVTGASWNRTLATGASTQIGANFSYSGTNAAPASFAVNGTTCGGGDGGGATPQVGITSPADGATVAAGADLPIAATATETGGSIAKVEFYDGSTLLGTDTTSPYAYTWAGVPAGAHTLTARAYDAAGASATSAAVHVTAGGGGGNTTAPKLHVSGNHLVDAAGATVRLRGANRSGGEFMCVQGYGFWDGPVDDASIAAMAAWHITAVRIPLNEDCWLGLSDVDSRYGGAAYQSEVEGFVSRLEAHGITPIVEMHWSHGTYTGPSSGCSDVNATCQKPMPDAQYAPAFWTGVAGAFKGDTAVVFDLFNEPYPERATGDETSGWTCWRDGGTCAGIPYQVAGFQSLVDAVRATGADNVVLVGGLAYSNDLTQWLAYEPSDPRHNLAAFAHLYNFNTCSNTSCFDSQLAPVAAKVPLTLSEIGENDCGHGFIDTVMNWADAHGVGYLGWTWNTWDCSSGPSLISDYNGTATPFGAGLRDHLAATS